MMTRDAIDRFDAGETNRVVKRGYTARSLSERRLNDTLVTSRKMIGSFSVKERTLISVPAQYGEKTRRKFRVMLGRPQKHLQNRI